MMNGREMFMGRSLAAGWRSQAGTRQRGPGFDMSARLQPVLAVDDDPILGRQALGDDGKRPADGADADRHHLDAVIGLDAVDVVAGLPLLYRAGRRHRGVLDHPDLCSRADEFTWPKRAVLVVEL